MGTELRVEVSEPDADDEAIDGLVRELRLELLELDVTAVSTPVVGAPPPGSKGPDLAAIGALLVQVTGSFEVVSSVVTAIRSWLRRGPPRRSLTLSVGEHTIELAAATEAQQQQLIDEFVRAVRSEH